MFFWKKPIMDDILCGKDNLEAEKELDSKFVKFLDSDRIQLNKWNANHPALMRNLYNKNLGKWKKKSLDSLMKA